MLVGYLGGRAAEELVFDTVTTGAANDIEQATKVARAMITQYGMSQKFGLNWDLQRRKISIFQEERCLTVEMIQQPRSIMK